VATIVVRGHFWHSIRHNFQEPDWMLVVVQLISSPYLLQQMEKFASLGSYWIHSSVVSGWAGK